VLLVVEDELHIQDLLRSALADAGFEVMTACNGEQAIAELDTGAGPRLFNADSPPGLSLNCNSVRPK
jgi:DNA-binding response OmpR family regulator